MQMTLGNLQHILTTVQDVRDAYTGLWNPDKKRGKKDVHLLCLAADKRRQQR